MSHSHRLSRSMEADENCRERSDFPIICDGCLGNNPYIRMTKVELGKQCHTCRRPFTVFRWSPGRNAKLKEPVVCRTCSKLQNVCQVCRLDLNTGLPVQVRDTALNISSNSAIPKYEVNRQYFAEEHDRRGGYGIDYMSCYGKVPNDPIMKLGRRTAPYSKRNQPRVCTFYVQGGCKRGVECPYRHEMPITAEMSQQNIQDRYYGVNDQVALKLLRKAAEMPSIEQPPQHESITTLYVGGINASISEQHLKDHFCAYGEIESIKMVHQKSIAFVTYATRGGAENAAQ